MKPEKTLIAFGISPIDLGIGIVIFTCAAIARETLFVILGAVSISRSFSVKTVKI